MAGIWSTRFLVSTSATEVDYTVPPSSIAVIRSVTVVNFQASGVAAWVVGLRNPTRWICGGMEAAIAGSSPMLSSSKDLRVVVQAGEEIYAVGAASLNITVSGYLFTN